MEVPHLRSPYEQLGGIFYFPRLLDKIRLSQAGELPEDYQMNLGKGFDGRCARFLGVGYEALADRVREGASDEEALDWAFKTGAVRARRRSRSGIPSCAKSAGTTA